MNIFGNEHHWIKKRFFDNPDDETLAMTTNYLCNEWLDAADRKVFETMRKQNPRRYKVAGLGDWGIVDGLVYENWEEKLFSIEDMRGKPYIKSVFGLDFGLIVSSLMWKHILNNLVNLYLQGVDRVCLLTVEI